MNCRRRKPAVTSGSYKGSGWQEAEASMELFGKGQSIAGRSEIVPAADGSLRTNAFKVVEEQMFNFHLAFATS
jgi:hypothetical protein